MVLFGVGGLPWWLRGLSVRLQCRRPGFNPWVGKIPWRRKWQPTPVFLPGESHGWRSLVAYSPWSHKDSDTTERLHFIWGTRGSLVFFSSVKFGFGNGISLILCSFALKAIRLQNRHLLLPVFEQGIQKFQWKFPSWIKICYLCQ